MDKENNIEQLVLSVGVNATECFSNYYIGENRQLVESLQVQSASLPHHQSQPFMYIWGSSRHSCSHLLKAACNEERKKTSVYLPMDTLIETSTEMLIGLENIDLVAIDHVQALAGEEAWEEALFHLFNRIQETGVSLLVAGDVPPLQLQLTLKDLQSRLSLGVCYQIESLDDQHKKQMIQFFAHQRGLKITEEVAHYIMMYTSRLEDDIYSLLNTLDESSLKEQRNITVPFVKKIILEMNN
jgi:DnaA family protein